MNFIELAQNRYSVRKFQDKPVEQEKLLKVLEAGRLAPSAVNFQPWQFIVINEPEMMKAFAPVYHRDWFNDVPACIVILGNHHEAWHRKLDGKDFTDVDAAIAIDHLTLAATDAGLGTCWVCNFDVPACISFFNLPENMEPIALLPIGYPADSTPPAKKRKALEEIVHWNQFEVK